MLPYFIIRERVWRALFISFGVTSFALLFFGFAKARVTGCKKRTSVSSALQTLVIGMIAAGASFGIVVAVNAYAAWKGPTSDCTQ